MPPSTDAPDGALGGARPFASADEAWFWTARVLEARRDQGQLLFGVEPVARPCDPDDVLRAIARLYRHRTLNAHHLRILGLWGRAQRAPCWILDARDHQTWREALDLLAWPLRIRGIVSPPPQIGAPA